MAENKDTRHREAYREEAYELLNELEESLLELETKPEDMDIISRVFRALHTIKGSGSMFGFSEIASYSHDVENVFDLVRNGKLQVTKDLIDLTLKSRDQIKKMLDSTVSGEAVDEAQGQEILSRLSRLLPREAQQAALNATLSQARATKKAAASTPLKKSLEYEETEEELQEVALVGNELTYRIYFKPSADIMLRGTDPLMLIEELRGLGRSYVIAHIGEVPPLEGYDPDLCYTAWDVLLTTGRSLEDIRSVFLFVEDDSEVRVTAIDDGALVAGEAEYKKIGEILVDRGTITHEDIEGIIGNQKRLGEVLVEKGLVSKREVESALLEQEHVKDVRRERSARDAANTVRVPADKLDRLVDLVGELVTVQARLTQKVQGRHDADLLSVSEEIEHLTSELHDNAMSIRMVPIGTTFSRFRRLVRDLSEGLGREINLVTEGADTELDKTVIDRLGDPLVHLIRNCVDHGIEPPQVREAAGKPRQGTVTLSAAHVGAEVLLSIADDGAGIDRAAVRAKAIEKGIIPHEAELSDQETFGLIFAPGFSTARRVTDVSGRGVGMDVVKRSIEALRGTVEVKSAKGLGTTIELRIPLTLAIIEGLLVRVSGEVFVVPLSVVEECVELGAKQIEAAHGKPLVNVRGELVPYIRLREQFRMDGGRPPMEQVVIVHAEGHRAGLAVDQVIGEHQTVIKSLSRVFRGVRSISGATILGNGNVALILDVTRLVERAEAEERGRTLAQ